MRGARNALYLERSYCPPGCREARPALPDSGSDRNSFGRRVQLSTSLKTAPAGVASSEPPDLGLSQGLLPGGLSGPPRPPGAVGDWEGDTLVAPRP